MSLYMASLQKQQQEGEETAIDLLPSCHADKISFKFWPQEQW